VQGPPERGAHGVERQVRRVEGGAEHQPRDGAVRTELGGDAGQLEESTATLTANATTAATQARVRGATTSTSQKISSA
jgi:hypothetical protein